MTKVNITGQLAVKRYDELRQRMAATAVNLEAHVARIASRQTDWADTFGPLTGTADHARLVIEKLKAATAPTWAELGAVAVDLGDYATVQDFNDAFDACEAAALVFRDWMRDENNLRRANVDYSDPLDWAKWEAPESVQKLAPGAPLAAQITAQAALFRDTLTSLS